MHNAYFEGFRFNSIYLDCYIAYYVIFLALMHIYIYIYITLTCIIVPFIEVFSYE